MSIWGRAAQQMFQLAHNRILFAAALGAEGESRAVAEGRGVRAARRSAILGEIERRCSDPGTNAVAIARSLGVTPRYVHLF